MVYPVTPHMRVRGMGRDVTTSILGGLGQKGGQVKRAVGHCKGAIGGAGPLNLGAVAVQFDPIAIGVIKINRFGHTMIGGAGQGPIRFDQATQSIGKRRAVGEQKGGVVKASLGFFPDQVLITIEDTGIGIESEDLQHVFEPFYRASNASNHKGHGIGLSLIQKIVKLHKGDIQVESIKGEGTTVKVSLPYSL